MADPVTWAVGLSALGTAVSAVGAIRQGQAAAASAEYNAKVAGQNEQIAAGQSVAASEALHRDQARKIGTAVASYGASGVDLATGSPTDVLADSARMAALDDLTLKYNYRLKGLGFQNQASLDTANAANSRTASYFSAAGSMLGGGARIAGYYV